MITPFGGGRDISLFSAAVWSGAPLSAVFLGGEGTPFGTQPHGKVFVAQHEILGNPTRRAKKEEPEMSPHKTGTSRDPVGGNPQKELSIPRRG